MPSRLVKPVGSLLLLVAVTVAVTVGCGGGAAPATSNTTPTDSSPTVPAATTAEAAPVQPVTLPVTASSSPEEVVLTFLNAMRDGNSGIAAALLTEQAQAETTKHQWPVQPPGAPSATYQLATPVFADPSQTVVHVPCLWTEADEAGGAMKFEVTWALRSSPAGWRVAGFATEVVAGQPHYFFNFEDIANLKETQAAAETAMAAAMQAESATSDATASDATSAEGAAGGTPAAEVANRPAGSAVLK